MLKKFSNLKKCTLTMYSTILRKSPSGIIIIDNQGIIQYVNPAIGAILGSTDVIGLNILEFNTIRNSKIYESILNAMNGISTELKEQYYISFTTGKEKYLNITIFPELEHLKNTVVKIILMIHDISEEIRLRKKVEYTHISTIEALANLVDAKDMYTGEHSRKVAKYTDMLCKELMLPNNERMKIYTASKFHDIGKIGISDFILNKADKLTLAEYEQMKKHPIIGSDIIRKVDGLQEVSTIIRSHHERWDGNGYPDGLKGDTIPYGAQIIAIADTFDALTSNRVYRKAICSDLAFEVLIREKEKQFNPQLVDVFINIIKNKPFLNETPNNYTTFLKVL